MKLMLCPHCHQLVSLRYRKFKSGKVRETITKCGCGKTCGKWLSDSITGVFNKGAVIVGIDNNTYVSAVNRYYKYKDLWSDRCDFFFSGWIPTKPGEVIIVGSVEEVISYPFEKDKAETKSTMPVSKDISKEDLENI